MNDHAGEVTAKPLTLTAGAAAYLVHLGKEGKRPSTLGTVKRTLGLLVAHLGEEQDVGKILLQDLDGFLRSEAATTQRGKPRAEASRAQIRRIVEATLAWMKKQDRGCVPLPADEERPVEPVEPVEIEAKKENAPSSPQGHAAVAAPVATPTDGAAKASYLDLTYQGQPSRFSITEVDRARLYGSRRWVALDPGGRECASALLTRDGQYVLPSGSTADLYVNESGDATPRRDLIAVDDDGVPLPTLASTTGMPEEVQGPLSADDLLEYVAVRVHALGAEALAPRLEEALRDGAIFRVPYRPRRTTTDRAAFLLGSEAGLFLVQAEPCGFEYTGLAEPAPPDNDPDDEDGFDAFAFPETYDGGEA